MFFIGQEPIVLQLGDILPFIKKEREGINLLFRGPSGYGKTELSKKCCNFLVGNAYEFCLGDKFKFNSEYWVHFVDEIHLMETPEILYPVMDGGRFVFIFATNFDSILPEALTNRCRNFVFTHYSDDELLQIFNWHSKLHFPESVAKHVIDISGRNPRVIVKTFISALRMHYKKQGNVPDNDQEIIEGINKIFGIEGGLDRISRQYLEVLEKLGGRANINRLSVATKSIPHSSICYHLPFFSFFKAALLACSLALTTNSQNLSVFFEGTKTDSSPESAYPNSNAGCPVEI